MMSRIMHTDPRFATPGDDTYKLTAVVGFLFSQLYKAKNCVVGFPSHMVDGERNFLLQHPEYMGAGLALFFEHKPFKKSNIHQLDFPAATAIGFVVELTPF
ncbi:unnamed protein product [Orchesella dallaii]|uniref:Uncharacterized protein n=1 Tax=Orchesella dallaii TaxID=48710 RepID=A0ABP1RNW1_9HEXA